MKIFKKLAAAGLAAVTAVSVFSFTACDNGGDHGDYGDDKSAQEATNVIEKLDNLETSGVKVNGTVKMSGMDIDVSALANAASGAFDVTLGMKNAAKPESNQSAYMYYFMRDWKIYSSQSLSPKDSFTAETLKPVVDLGSMLAESVGAQANTMLSLYVPTLVKAVISAETYTLLSLGKVTNSVAYKDNTITLDYNLAAYNMLNDVKEVINGVTATTTVGDILGNETLKKYAEVFTELVSYNDIVSAVTSIKALLASQTTPVLPSPAAENDGESDDGYPEYPDSSESLAIASAIVDVLDSVLKSVTPEEGSSTYGYLLKLISSDELKAAINDMIGEEVLEKNLSQYSAKDILSLVMDTELTDEQVNTVLASYKAQIEEATKDITAESVTIQTETVTVTESGMKYTFTYDSEYLLLSQGIEGTVSVVNSSSTSGNTTVTINLNIEYSKDLLTLIQLPATLPAFPANGDNE